MMQKFARYSSLTSFKISNSKRKPSSLTMSPCSLSLHHNSAHTNVQASYRFSLPTPKSILGLPIGQHISIAATLPITDASGNTVSKEVVRSYTPISSDHQPGHFDLLLKSYPTGNISKYMASLIVGQTIKVKGPKGNMVYTPNMVRAFGMIAGGTGITPMLQIIRAIVRGRATGDKTEINLIFANVGREDILLKEDLDELAKTDSRFNVHYVLNNPPEKWDGGVGFVTPEMIKVCVFWCSQICSQQDWRGIETNIVVL